MKKVLAIVLAVVMTFSMVVSGFALEGVSQGQLYFGMIDNALANPGETIDIPLYYSCEPFETDNYPTDGYLVLTLNCYNSNPDLVVLNTFTPTAEWMATGATIYKSPDFTEDTPVEEMMGDEYHSFIQDTGSHQTTFVMPASAVKNDLQVATLNVTISPTWEVVDNVATRNIDMTFGAYAMFISEEDGQAILAGEMNMYDAGFEGEVSPRAYAFGDRDIASKPYEFTNEEYLTEYMKGIGALILEALSIGISFLTKELTPAPWYDPANPPEGLEFLTEISKALEEVMGKLLGEIL